jgi:cytochrome c oxidase cbb3-type subunit I
MWVSGIMEGLMWREYTPQGYLANSFVETVAAKKPENIIRTIGGLMYLAGAVIMSYNLWRTIRLPSLASKADAELAAAPAPALLAAE